VPKTLEPILNKRRGYKELMKDRQGKEREIYDQRQTALKWVLGYVLRLSGVQKWPDLEGSRPMRR